MKVTVDASVCIGSGQCCEIAAAIFGVDQDGRAFAKTEAPDDAHYDEVKEAWEMCPSGAIRVSPEPQ
jgi:ferredoxin